MSYETETEFYIFLQNCVDVTVSISVLYMYIKQVLLEVNTADSEIRLY